MRSVKNGMFVSSNHEAAAVRMDSREELIGNFDGFTNFSYMESLTAVVARQHPFIDNEIRGEWSLA